MHTGTLAPERELIGGDGVAASSLARGHQLEPEAHAARPHPVEGAHQHLHSAGCSHLADKGGDRHFARRRRQNGIGVGIDATAAQHRETGAGVDAESAQGRQIARALHQQEGAGHGDARGHEPACDWSVEPAPSPARRSQRIDVGQMHDRVRHGDELQRHAAEHRRTRADTMNDVGALGLEDAGQPPRRTQITHRIAPGRTAIEVDCAGAQRLDVAETPGGARHRHHLATKLGEHAEERAATLEHEAVLAGEQHDLARPLRKGRAVRASAGQDVHPGVAPCLSRSRWSWT